MPQRNFPTLFLSLIFLVCSTAGYAQTGQCEPGHKFSPSDHQRIVAAIARNAPDVMSRIDLKDINRGNRASRVLEGALKAEGIPAAIKECIREILRAPPISPEERDKRELSLPPQLLAAIRLAQSVSELEAAVRSQLDLAIKTAQNDLAASLEAASQILQAGKQTIYDSRFYENATRRFGSKDPAVIAQRMALKIAKSDAIGALAGGLAGFLLGPEGAFAGACTEAVLSSAIATLEIFSDLWFETG